MASSDAIAAAEVIIREAAYAVGGEVRPLPLAGSFNVGEDGWGPTYQTTLLEAGHKILPWLDWPDDIDVSDPTALAAFDAYYEEYLTYCKDLGLPLFFRCTQWDGMLLEAAYETGDPETSSSAINPAGTVLSKLSPFGLLAHWDAPATRYMDLDSWRRIYSFYPSPPMVIFHSNNEAGHVRWGDLETESKYYVDTYGTEQTDAFKKALLADQWTARYQRMIATMKSTLATDSSAWASVVRFVGYDAFGKPEFGRYSGWETRFIVTEDAITPDWEIWDGGTMSYYMLNSSKVNDFNALSNQVEACNFPFMEAEAKAANPDYLCELAIFTGDGDGTNAWWPALGYGEEYEARSKTVQFVQYEQTYDLDRYQGWAQFGLWLTRPFVLREFRYYNDELDNWPGYFERLTSIVDAVHEYASKTLFWRTGTLVVNADYTHPYQTLIPTQYADVDRSFLLTTSSDPDRPWSYSSDWDVADVIPVFAIAYVIGEEGSRYWLLYAHAPLGAVADCTITIPGCGDVTVDVPVEGGFWTYGELAEREYEEGDDDMLYRFKARSTTVGAYRLASGVLANLIGLGDIQEGVGRGDGGVGTFVVPDEDEVESGVDYGAGGTEFTGTAEGLGGDTVGVFGLRRTT